LFVVLAVNTIADISRSQEGVPFLVAMSFDLLYFLLFFSRIAARIIWVSF
jgi:hypothetical protein